MPRLWKHLSFMSCRDSLNDTDVEEKTREEKMFVMDVNSPWEVLVWPHLAG